MSDADWALLLPEGVLLAGALAALLGGSFLPRRRQWLVTPLALATLVAAALIAVVQAGPPVAAFTGTWALDGPTTVLRVAAPLACAAVLLLGARERRGGARESETVALLLLGTLGAVVLAAADDLLLVVTGYLLASIPVYGLIGLGRERRQAEGALKAYLQGAVFGVLLLGGVAVLAGLGGGTAYARLVDALPHAPAAAVAVGGAAVVVALLFEAGAVPAHFWVPDAAEAAPVQVAAFLTTVPKIAAVVAVLRIVGVLQPAVAISLVVGVAAAATMLLGTFAAFWQDDVRRLLGWSAVGQAGFLLLPAALDPASAASGALLVAATGYAAANLAAFAVVAALPGRRRIADWRGAGRAHPVLTGVLLVALLALVGTPPTSVFLGKIAVFSAAWTAGAGWLVAAGALATVASLFYTLRWLFAAVRPASGEPDAADPVAGGTAVALGALVLAFAALLPVLAAAGGLAR